MTCKNCKQEVTNNRCTNCGQPIKVERINAQFYKNVLAGVFFLGWEALYTVKAVLIRPGKSIREYVLEDRSKLMNPITFQFLMFLFYSIISFVFSFDPPEKMIDSITYTGVENYESFYYSIMAWLNSHQAISNLIIGSFESIWLYWFFKKQRYNFFEILTLVCYVSGVGIISLILVDIIESFGLPNWMVLVSFLFFMIYAVWATARFFGNTIWSYVKVFFSFVLGIILIFIVIALISFFADLVYINLMLEKG